jgi:hypothetical protein
MRLLHRSKSHLKYVDEATVLKHMLQNYISLERVTRLHSSVTEETKYTPVDGYNRFSPI